jgi:hypothetical protein
MADADNGPEGDQLRAAPPPASQARGPAAAASEDDMLQLTLAPLSLGGPGASAHGELVAGRWRGSLARETFGWPPV